MDAPATNRIGSETEGFARFEARARFGSLDGLRALAVLAVILHHSALQYTTLSPLRAPGDAGVSLFFAISGFLITTLLLRETAVNGRISLGRFYARRTLRIFPLYYAALAVYAVLAWRLERDSVAGREFFANLPAFASYTSNWFVAPPSEANGFRVIFYFAWSLATEEQFYLLWPPLLVLLGVRRAALGVVIVLGATLAARTIEPATDQWTQVLRIARSFAPAICVGTLMAICMSTARGFSALAPILARRWCAPAALGASMFASSVFMPVNDAAASLVQAVAFSWLVGACVSREDHPLARLLAWKPLAWIGMISYGVYLLHMLCLNVARRGLDAAGLPPQDGAIGWIGLFITTTAITILVASVSFLTFERMFLSLKSRFAAGQANRTG